MDTDSPDVQLRCPRSEATTIQLGDRHVIASGKHVRIATVFDEDWLERPPVEEPNWYIAAMKAKAFKADIFSFTQEISDIAPKFSHPFEWDNLAAIQLTTFADWSQNQISRKTRQEIARSKRMGVVIRQCELDNRLVEDITFLFGAIPIKQGKTFRHFGKKAPVVRRELSGYLERSEFICAYHASELIGYIKLVYGEKKASVLNLVTNNSHYDKRPGNALIARAVEICCERKLIYLIYGKFVYGNKTTSPLTDFKRRNGFKQVMTPRYYIPLNMRGKIFMKLGLHLGLLALVPHWAIVPFVALRARLRTSN